MSTAQTPQPDDTAGPPGAVGTPEHPEDRTPGAPDATRSDGQAERPDPVPWRRRLLVGLVAGLLTWGLAALLSPE
ncbi:hypothetical protein GTW65_24545, partial [Streptomyces sp. SID4956]|nr:hypothetical protein [Streptomyces sp. SID4956]